MEVGNRQGRENTGLFLRPGNQLHHRRRPIPRWLTVTVLLAWDGVLLYMIVHCLIEPVYGAVFVAVVSVYLGYQL